MSRQEIIRHLVENQRLFYLSPLIRSDEVKRCMYVSPIIWNVMWQEAWSDQRAGRLFARMRESLDFFTTGGLVSVADHPYNKSRSAFLARLDPKEDDFWDIRVIDPSPGARIFGAFSDKDEFVALTYGFRDKLAGINQDKFAAGVESFDQAINRCKAIWRNMFHTYPPHKGGRISDYISENCISA